MPRGRPEDYLLGMPSPGYGGGGYGGPDRYGTLQSLLMERGRLQSEAALRSGELWANTFNNIGQSIAGGLQAHQEKKALQKRDAAWIDYIGRGEWASDPKQAYAESVRVWGPEKGPEMFKGLAAVSQLSQDQGNPEQDMKALGVMGAAMDKMSPEGRAMLYPQAIALSRKRFPQLQLPEQYSEETWKAVSPYFTQLSGGKAPEGFTLSPGQKRFDASGKEIAAAPEEAPKPEGPRVVGRSLIGPDGKVIYRDPDPPREPRAPEALEAVMGPDGNPVLVPRSQAAGKRPASSREQGRAVISGDANRISEINTAVDDMGVLSEALSGAGKTGAIAGMKASVPDWATSLTGIGAEAKVTQSLIDQMRQTFGKTLEGGVLRKEDEVKYAKILPKITDSPEVVKGKIPQLVAQMERNRENRLNALEDAGYDVGRFRQRLEGGQTPKAPTKVGRFTVEME